MYNVLYSASQYDTIKDNIDSIEQRANDVVDKVLYPTLEMKNNIFQVILQFIVDNNAIMFGDYMNQLSMTDTKQVSKALMKESWMATSTPIAYTHDPQTVLVEMVDHLKSKLVSRSSAQSIHGKIDGGGKATPLNSDNNNPSLHSMLAPRVPEIGAGELQKIGTFVIQVDIIRYMYIRYVPKNIYDSLKCTSDGVDFIHPAIRAIDNLMVVTDPLRQVNEYKGALEILQNTSWNHTKFHPASMTLTKSSPRQHSMAIINAIMDCIVDKKMILIGELCFNMYKKYAHSRTNKPPLQTYMHASCLQAITNEFENDLLYIIKSLQSFVSVDDLSITHHEPFLTYRGKNALICHKKTPLLRLYHHNNQCVPFHELPSIVHPKQGDSHGTFNKKKSNPPSTTTIMVATWNVMLLHLYIDWMESFQTNNITAPYERIVELLELRRNFHQDTNTTPLDNTMFQEFKIDCRGKTLPFRQAESMRRQARFKARKMVSWKYQPMSGVKPLELPKISGSKSLLGE